MWAGRLDESRPVVVYGSPVCRYLPPVRPSKLGIIGLGAIGGSLALQAKRAAPAAPHPPLGAFAHLAQVEIAPLDRAARP